MALVYLGDGHKATCPGSAFSRPSCWPKKMVDARSASSGALVQSANEPRDLARLATARAASSFSAIWGDKPLTLSAVSRKRWRSLCIDQKRKMPAAE